MAARARDQVNGVNHAVCSVGIELNMQLGTKGSHSWPPAMQARQIESIAAHFLPANRRMMQMDTAFLPLTQSIYEWPQAGVHRRRFSMLPRYALCSLI